MDPSNGSRQRALRFDGLNRPQQDAALTCETPPEHQTPLLTVGPDLLSFRGLHHLQRLKRLDRLLHRGRFRHGARWARSPPTPTLRECQRSAHGAALEAPTLAAHVRRVVPGVLERLAPRRLKVERPLVYVWVLGTMGELPYTVFSLGEKQLHQLHTATGKVRPPLSGPKDAPCSN
jgi:hypothetical protein